MAVQDILAMMFGGGMPQQPWDEVPRDEQGRPLLDQFGMPKSPASPAPPMPGQLPRQQGGWKAGLGNVIRGAIDAGATPNIAGGGATDVFRAMQAAGDRRQERSLLDYNMGRQQEQDELRRRQVDAQAEADRARAEYWKEAREPKPVKPPPIPTTPIALKVQQINAILSNPNSTPEEIAAAQAELDKLAQPKPPAVKEVPMVEISPELGKARGLMPNAEGKYFVPANSAAARETLRQVPPARDTVLSPGSALARDGKIIVTNPRVPASRGGGSGGEEKKTAPQSTFSAIERDFQQRIADANRLHATGQIDNAQRQRLIDTAEAGYHRAVIAAGGSTDYFDKKGAASPQQKTYQKTATDAQGNKVGWDGTKWVPIPR